MRPAPEPCRHDFGRQEWQPSIAGQDVRSRARWLERGWIKGPPLRGRPSPIRGVPTVGKNVRSLLVRRKGRASSGVSIVRSLRASLRGLRSKPCLDHSKVSHVQTYVPRVGSLIRFFFFMRRNPVLKPTRPLNPSRKVRGSPPSEATADHDVHGNLQFGPFELSSRERMLRREGVVLPLGGRALDILIYLAERPGEVIEKRELIDYVWSDVTVEEGSLRVHVAAIRRALGDGQFGNRYIANIKGRGYAFVCTVPSQAIRETGTPNTRTKAGPPRRWSSATWWSAG